MHKTCTKPFKKLNNCIFRRVSLSPFLSQRKLWKEIASLHSQGIKVSDEKLAVFRGKSLGTSFAFHGFVGPLKQVDTLFSNTVFPKVWSARGLKMVRNTYLRGYNVINIASAKIAVFMVRKIILWSAKYYSRLLWSVR